MKIVVLDYGMGNLQSVYNAFMSLGADVEISSSPRAVGSCNKLVVPGVGAFQDTIEELCSRGLFDAVKGFIASGKPYLGICLGLQILFEGSEEGDARGLSIFGGKVKRFRKKKGLKVPHMGWNSISIVQRATKPLDEIDSGSYFYFVHSYYAAPLDKKITACETEYGGVKFASMIARDNVYATQFHPEKSQGVGLKFLKNFVEL